MKHKCQVSCFELFFSIYQKISMIVCLSRFFFIPLHSQNSDCCHYLFGMWRSWLAYASGGRVVASSSLVIPTKKE